MIKFTFNKEKALKLQQKISAKDRIAALSNVTIKINLDGSTDLFAANSHILGAFFAKEEDNQEDMNFNVYEDEIVFTVDLRPLQKLKKTVTLEYIDCTLDKDMIHMKLNHYGEELSLRIEENTIFDKFVENLNYNNYTSNFNGETIIPTESLNKVAFGNDVLLMRSIEDHSRFLITNTGDNYRGVILGNTIIEVEDQKDPTQQDLPLDINPEEPTSINVKKLNKIAENIANDPYIKKQQAIKAKAISDDPEVKSVTTTVTVNKG